MKNLNDERLMLLNKLIKFAETCDITAFEGFYFPLLRSPQQQVALKPGLHGVYCPVFIAIIPIFIRRYVQAQPPLSDWSRPRAGCSGRIFNGRNQCPDCPDFDAFLVDARGTLRSLLLARYGKIICKTNLGVPNAPPPASQTTVADPT